MVGNVTHIITLEDEGLELYRTLKRPVEHRQQGLFVAEGRMVVERFLTSDLSVLSVLLTEEWFNTFREAILRRKEAIQIFIAEKKLLEAIVGFHCHQGVMAVGTVPPPVSIESALTASPSPRFFAAVDGLSSAENTGVLVRNCAACGVQALIVGQTSADPYLRRAVRNSMGSVFALPLVYSPDLKETLVQLHLRHGFRTFAAHPRPGSAPVFEADFTGNSCVVFGSEGEGVSGAVAGSCDQSIAIPMMPGIDSLNVACASAAVLYEALRQRRRLVMHE